MKYSRYLFTSLALIVGFSIHAEHHEEAQTQLSPVSMQVNLCSLNDGASFKDIEKLDRRYQKWMNENEVERTVVRQTPLMFAQATDEPFFLDFQIGTHEAAGRAWNLWMNTKAGQELNEEWQRIANCQVRLGTLYRKFAAGLPEEGENRIVSINWCEKHENKSWQQMADKHTFTGPGAPGGGHAVFWGVMVPQVAGYNLPGDFAHIMTYNNMEDYMARQRWFDLEGGADMYNDYNTSYATCRGPNLFAEEILHIIELP